jgi:hypothetical protein
MDRGVDETVLLALIDRRGAVAKIAAVAHTDFDKYEFVAVGHHEIDLTASCPVVARDETKAVTDKEPFGCAFGATTESCSPSFWFRVPQSAERPAHHDSQPPTPGA